MKVFISKIVPEWEKQKTTRGEHIWCRECRIDYQVQLSAGNSILGQLVWPWNEGNIKAEEIEQRIKDDLLKAIE